MSESPTKYENCPYCDGDGACPECFGTGEVGNYPEDAGDPCPSCRGTGACPNCSLLSEEEKTANTIQWFTDSPDAGDPRCVCSWCAMQIFGWQTPAIRICPVNGEHAGEEARFHRGCYMAAFGDNPESAKFDDTKGNDE